MIIGIDATRANKPQKTGVEWYSFFLIKELPKLDPTITFRLYFNSAPETELLNLGPNVEYRRLYWPFKYLWTQVRLSLEMLFNPPDVLFIPASIIPIISPKRTVTTLHDVAYEAYKNDLSWKGRAYQRLSAKWAKKFCSQIITVSQFSKSEIIKYYQIAADKIQVTYLGLSNPEKIPPASKQKKNYLLFVGRLESKKNIAQLIRIFAAMQKTSWGKRISLHLVGYPSRGWQEAEALEFTGPSATVSLVGAFVQREAPTLTTVGPDADAPTKPCPRCHRAHHTARVYCPTCRGYFAAQAAAARRKQAA